MTATADTRTMRERMLAGDLYIADDPELAAQNQAALDLMDAYNATTVRQGPLRRRLLEELLGDDVQIGPNVQLLTPTHPVEPEPRRATWEAAEPITIGDNVWLGGGVIVCPGVKIGENTVVGAGAVVTKDLPANVVAVGNPAKVIRQLEG
ncbi:maltose acetyltransferase domain-containing protein [Georgenia thermotolerans]|uniref:Sugar O-acetyltransferase n=1 Tax=Georgenia thermotolerans TaxID=527326 RepID=A0A7J5URJ9_9MICO|nr:maltose acetyltransferase domain-containing protein [Georgenia thermotolerans]KAE8764841.1 sugar O-acetyltransferase [Georgenia thermotolerans]